MPELPEVETMVRGIRPYVEGRTVTSLRRCRCACKPLSATPALSTISRRVKGQTVVGVRRRAKRILFDFATGETLIIEPRMTGLLLLSEPPDREHLRLQWCLSGSKKYDSLWYWDRRGLGTVRLCTKAELAELLGPRNLGPDALEMKEGDWRERCARTARPIKVALMDQKLVAGIGNLYASEILHRAGIHPSRPANMLKPRHIRRLDAAVKQILCEAIRCEGSTLNDATYRNSLNKNGRYQHQHGVYGRENETCNRCGVASIQRTVQAQRSTFFCPLCQK